MKAAKILILILMFLALQLVVIGCKADGQETAEASVSPPLETETNITATPSPFDTTAPITTTEPDVTKSPGVNKTSVATTSAQNESLSQTPYKPGDKGEDVVLLQNMLIKLGFDPGEPDGTYGDALQKAVRNFQLYVGYDADGIAGQKTVNALIERYDEAKTVSSQTDQPLKGYTIGIDPGHQRNDDSDTEPLMPGSSDMKKKVSSGTTGRFTNVPEYVINLQVSLKLKAALEAMGAKVVMTRETHGVDISNAERAEKMNKAGVDCWLRIHANGSDDPNIHGMFILVPAKGCMAAKSDSVQEESVSLAKVLLKDTVAETQAKDLGIKERTDQTGFGWSKVPVCNIEMGHMTNKGEDNLLVSETYQKKIVAGLANGFVEFFNK